MFAKLLGTVEPPKKVFRRTLKTPRFTRFTNHHARTTDLEYTPEPSPLLLPITSMVRVDMAAPAVNPLDHLHSNAPIPVDLLRRTLPQRFREMDLETADCCEQAQANTPFKYLRLAAE